MRSPAGTGIRSAHLSRRTASLQALAVAAVCALGACRSAAPKKRAEPSYEPEIKESSPGAVERRQTEVEIGKPPYRVAIVARYDQPDSSPQTTMAVRRTLRRAFELTAGLFIPLTGSELEDAPFDPADSAGWAQRSVHTVVALDISQRGHWLIARASVYLPARGDGIPVRRYALRERGRRRLAYRLGNALYELHTGQPGPFLSRIAFVAGSAGAKGLRQIFVVDFTGEGVRRMSYTGDHNILPSWAPNGDLIYTSYVKNNPDLYLLPAGKSEAHPISERSGLNVGGTFSPDGQQIALTLSKSGNSDIYIIGRDGRMIRQLTHHESIDASPTWSPDGSHIAFVSERAGYPHLFMMSTNGKAPPVQLTTEGFDNQEPEWCRQPGSHEIAYTSRDESKRYAIYILDTRTKKRRRLTRGAGNEKSPSWSPDCRLIVYSAGKGGLWVMSTDSSLRRQVYRSRAYTPVWSPR